jgi:hypothetical protein
MNKSKTNYSQAEQRIVSPFFGNVLVGRMYDKL